MAKGDLTIVLDERDYRDLMGRLNNLKDVDKKTAIINSLKNGMRVIQNAGKTNLRLRDLHTSKKGNLKKSFTIKLDRKKSVAQAGFKRPAGNHSFLVDVGTKKRFTKKGYNRGTVQKKGAYTGNRFWHDAVEQNGGNATRTLLDTVASEVEKIMNRRGY